MCRISRVFTEKHLRKIKGKARVKTGKSEFCLNPVRNFIIGGLYCRKRRPSTANYNSGHKSKSRREDAGKEADTRNHMMIEDERSHEVHGSYSQR